MGFINICGSVVANTTYVSNVLVAKDVETTLPEIAPVISDIEAMGTMSMPIWQRIDNMSFEITKIGLDLGLGAMITPEPLAIELRFVQQVIDADGKAGNKGCKAFIKGIPTAIPGGSIKPGESISSAVPYVVTRYQLFVDGSELCLIDRLAGIVRINGIDYMKEVSSLL